MSAWLPGVVRAFFWSPRPLPAVFRPTRARSEGSALGGVEWRIVRRVEAGGQADLRPLVPRGEARKGPSELQAEEPDVRMMVPPSRSLKTIPPAGVTRIKVSTEPVLPSS